MASIVLITYSATLAIAGAAGSQVKAYEKMPFSGRITEIEIHWPDGCNALVNVAVWHINTQICPMYGYLHLNNATPKYKSNRLVTQGDEVWVDMVNGDGANTHNITVSITLESLEK